MVPWRGLRSNSGFFRLRFDYPESLLDDSYILEHACNAIEPHSCFPRLMFEDLA